MIPLIILKKLALILLLSAATEHLAHKDGDYGYDYDSSEFEEFNNPDLEQDWEVPGLQPFVPDLEEFETSDES